jgi:ketosteroid isomerase-like protein
LGDVDREMIEHRVRTIMELRATGSVEKIGDYLASDVVCHSRGHWAATLFPRPVVGKLAAIREMHRINMNYQNLDSEIHELLIDGDRVVVHRTTVGRNRGSGSPYQFDTVTFFRFREGLITEISEYFEEISSRQLEDL